MTDFNIICTSAGRRYSLVRHFKETLRLIDVAGKVITADVRKDAAAAFAGDLHLIVPPVSASDYIACLLDICQEFEVKMLVPLIDAELPVLAAAREKFAALGTTCLISSFEANRICFDKRLTLRFFAESGIDSPRLLEHEELEGLAEEEFPLLLKPATGSSSVGVTKVNNRRELDFFNEYIDEPVVQEYIEGDEYTLDILADFHGGVRCVVPRLRIETRAGESSKGMTVKNVKIMEEGKRLVEALPGANGCITVQCFNTKDGRIRFIEINPRFGGGYPLSIAAGADYPRWIIEELMGRQPQISFDGWQDGVAMLRHDEEIITNRVTIT